MPFMLHIGGGGRPLRRRSTTTAAPVTDFLGGGENIRAKDYMAIAPRRPRCSSSAMVLDGVFERFPGLRGGCIEQGAMWVVPWLRRLDIAQSHVRQDRAGAAHLPMPASEYVHRPAVVHAVPDRTRRLDDRAGGRRPVPVLVRLPAPRGRHATRSERFEATMGSVDDVAKERFYADNFAEMMGGRVMAGAVRRELSSGAARGRRARRVPSARRPR